MQKLEFFYKGKGRIFVFNEYHIEKVERIINFLDQDEFENYYPKNLVTVLNENNLDDLIYTGKFNELNIFELIKECAKHGIGIFVRAVPLEQENYFM